ncbi:hypothetical protein [Paracidovorax oryzae]|uniref:hypothetical protein n=1 Tax=Paracidovorax oryzae TaxID=862720 RepID=UPI0035D09E17
MTNATMQVPAAIAPRRTGKAEKPAVAVPPMAQAPSSSGSEAADWQAPAREAIAQIANFLDQTSEPAPSPKPTDPPTELIDSVAFHEKGSQPVDAFDVLDRIGEIGNHWWSVIDSLLEAHKFHDRCYPEPIEPLPQWAVDRLKDRRRHQASEHEYHHQRQLLRDWLHLAAGDGSQYRFEVWTSRGSRLAFRHESLQDAAVVLEQLKPKHPDAFIARVHVRSGPPSGRQDDPALLDTLIGSVHHIGTFCMGDEEKFTVQDETGRQVTVPASVLFKHPVCERLDKHGKESLAFYLESIKPRKERIRAEANGGAQ